MLFEYNAVDNAISELVVELSSDSRTYKGSRRPESNRRPTDYESVALPAVPRRLVKFYLLRRRKAGISRSSSSSFGCVGAVTPAGGGVAFISSSLLLATEEPVERRLVLED